MTRNRRRLPVFLVLAVLLAVVPFILQERRIGELQAELRRLETALAKAQFSVNAGLSRNPNEEPVESANEITATDSATAEIVEQKEGIDFETAVAELNELRGKYRFRHPRVIGVIEKLDPAEKANLLEYLPAVEDADLRLLITLVAMDDLVEQHSFEAIVAFAREYIPEEKQSQILSNALRPWTKENPQDAADWFIENHLNEEMLLGHRKQRDAMAGQMVYRLAESEGTEAAMAFWSSLTDPEAGLETLLTKAEDIPALVEAMRVVASPGHMRAALEASGEMLGKQDLPAARSWAESLPGGKSFPASEGVVQVWLKSQPEEAATWWLDRTKTPAERSRAYEVIMEGWAEHFPNTAGQWLGKQPQDATLDRAKARFASAVASRDPESALAWAETIVEPDLRNHTLSELRRPQR